MYRRKSLIIFLSVMFALSMVLVGCTSSNNGGITGEPIEGQGEQEEQNQEQEAQEEQASNAGDIVVYTSIYPLYDFATKIGGDRVEVENLVPPGAEPHDFDPGPQDIVRLSEADLFVYNGGGMELWIETIIDAVGHPGLTVVNSTEEIELLTPEETGHTHDDHDHNDDDHNHSDHDSHGRGHDNGDHNHNDDHDHDHGEFDPHVWVDPTMAKQQAQTITDGLIDVDPDHADYYQSNYEQLAEQLDQLHADFQDLSDHITRRDFVVSHEAFGYLAYRYGLNQVSITGLSPANEPSARDLQEIIEFVNRNDIEYILYENYVTPQVAENVREEVGAEALVLHNLEVLTQDELDEGNDYFSIMEDNLNVLKQALDYEG